MNGKLSNIIIAILLLLVGSINTVAAGSITITGNKDEIVINNVTRADVFIKFSESLNNKIPESYKYIELKFLDIEKESELHDALQKLVYLDLIQNRSTNIGPNKTFSAYAFLKLAEKIYGIKFVKSDQIKDLKDRKVNQGDLSQLNHRLNKSLNDFKDTATNRSVLKKKAIFVDAYQTLLEEHYDNENIDEEKALENAIEGLTKATNDKYTVYFPATDSKDFYESLNGEYEGIGSYVDMEKPGVLRITSPIKGSPSEKAGLKGGDIVTHVDGKEVLETHSLKEVVSWIKGPAGSKVNLTIKRKNSSFEIEVIRGKIVIRDIDYDLINKKTFYIEIKSFGETVSENFKESLIELNKHKQVDKVIIDLRNNGGGFLGEVADMLSHFVAKGEKTAVVKYKEADKSFSSSGYDLVDFSKYEIIILQNSGTASASEIMIGTLKDYYPNIEIIGEQSYGKGSVQTVRQYSDGSTLKYTIAKWFTGKTETGIDGVGITPSIELEFDLEKFKKYDVDNQLEKAIYLK